MNEINVPIKVVHLFQPLDDKLQELLRSLNADDWQKPTIAKLWRVKDIAAHLLDGNMRTLSASRDHHFGEKNVTINTHEDLVNYLNELNAQWVKAMQRVSPQLLTELLAITGKAFATHMSQADLLKPAIFPVSWAGEEESLNWFHIAREYTEKWIHQQQIRHAVGQDGIMTREFFYPFIDTFMRALPHTYRDVEASPNTAIKIIITSTIGGEWYLRRLEKKWVLTKETSDTTDAEILIGPETAWKLFSKGTTPAESVSLVEIKGNRELALTALTMVSVMA